MNQLNITIYKQQYSNTCVHTVLRVVAEYFGFYFNYGVIFELLGSDPNGYTLKDAARKLNKVCSTRHKTLKTIGEISKYIENGHLVMAGDNQTYSDGHATLIVGVDPENFSVFDPNTGIVKLINKKQVFDRSDENIGIYRI